MHKIITTLLFVFIFSSCTYGIRENKEQISNKSYFFFTGNLTDITVVIGNSEPFTPTNEEISGSLDEYKLYQVEPGTHKIKIMRNNEIIASKTIYIGNQEKKEILVK